MYIKLSKHHKNDVNSHTKSPIPGRITTMEETSRPLVMSHATTFLHAQNLRHSIINVQKITFPDTIVYSLSAFPDTNVYLLFAIILRNKDPHSLFP